MQDTIVVYTEVPRDTIVAEGGLGEWVLNPEKANKHKYLVCCRKSRWNNRAEGIAEDTAFLIGTIKTFVQAAGAPNTRGQHRYFIEISDYALLDKPNVWGNWRNPVRYTSLKSLGIVPGSLRFQPISRGARSSAEPKRLTIAEAKKALAESFGVSPEDVEITIRG